MREYTKKPESQSRTLDSNPKASRQALIDMILQRYKERKIQRYAEDKKIVQGRFDTAQHKEIDEDEFLQGKFESVPTSEQEAIQREERPNNTGLPDNLKIGVENLSGFNMDDVRVHYNSSKPAQLQALAYAQGTDIHIAPGQEQHLPHEAWHVVQQIQGRVRPTIQMQGLSVNDNETLEREASTMGNRAISVYGKKSHDVKTPYMRGNIFQLKWISEKNSHVYTWDKVLNGLRWYYNTTNGNLWYMIENAQILGEHFKKLELCENKEYSISEWEKAGWKILKIDEENKVIPITELPLFPGKEGLKLLRESGIIPYDKPEEKGIAEKYWWEALSRVHYPAESTDVLVSIYQKDIKDKSFLQWINSEECLELIRQKIETLKSEKIKLESEKKKKWGKPFTLEKQREAQELSERMDPIEKELALLEKISFERVTYMDLEIRKEYLLSIANHIVKSKSKLTSRNAFVMNSKKDIYSAPKATEGSTRIHHSSFLSGVSVSSAGCLCINGVQEYKTGFEGNLESINDYSGHYQPGIPEMKRVCDHLANDCNSPNIIVKLEKNTDKLTKDSLSKMRNSKLTVKDFLDDATFKQP